MMRNLLALIGLLTLVFAIGFAAYANRNSFYDDTPRKMAVSFEGLDLSSDQGRHILEQRIKRALSAVCGDEWNARPLGEKTLIMQCRRDALAATRPQVERAVEVAMRRRRAADLAEAALRDQGAATN